MNTFLVDSMSHRRPVCGSPASRVLGGLIVVFVLLGTFMLGIRLKNRESPRPTDEQPSRPETDRLPGEMSGTAGLRRCRRPTASTGSCRTSSRTAARPGSETSPEPPSGEKRKWGGISSGGFGSGGTGHGD